MNEISLCPNCYCMTKSIHKERGRWVCGKCGQDKTSLEIIDSFIAELDGKKKIKESEEK